MYNRQSFRISHEEFIKLAKLKRVEFNHEIVSSMPTIVKPLLGGFIGLDGELTKKDVIVNLLGELYNKELIEEKKGWRVSITPHHRFSAYNDEGYAQSIYTVEVEVYKQEVVGLKTLDERKEVVVDGVAVDKQKIVKWLEQEHSACGVRGETERENAASELLLKVKRGYFDVN